MKFKIILLLFLCYFKSSELAKTLIKLDNGWNLAYPCKDNNKITMLIDNDEVKKSDFNYILSIQGITTFGDTVTLQRALDKVVNGVDYVEDKYKLTPGQMSFSTDLKGRNGKLPKLKSITIDGVNYCKEPDNAVFIRTPNQNFNVVTPSGDDIQPATSSNKYPVSLEPALNDPVNKDYDDDDYVNIGTKVPVVDNNLINRIHNGEGTCGVRKIEHTGLIVRGYASKPGDWPWHAALNKVEKTTSNYICGGTLISKFMVLTAAHCVTEAGVPIVPDILHVNLGIYMLFGENVAAQTKGVFRIIVHENFNPTILKNDIALLKIKTEAIYSDYVQPACIWRDEYYSKLSSPNIFGTMAGWGFNQTQTLSFVLQQAQLPKIPDKKCLTSNPTFFGRALNEYNFCAGYRNGTSACNGDSGGGYHIFIPDNPNEQSSYKGKWYVHGIVSLAVALRDQAVCDPNHYVLFTDVGKFTEWIDKNSLQI